MLENDIPDQFRYTEEHLWLDRLSDTRIRVGLTDHAQSVLGKIEFVQLPDIGSETEAGEAFGEVESQKTVTDLFAPISGTIAETNSMLADSPELLNADPYGEGWLVVLGATSDDDLESQLEYALDPEQYSAICSSE